MRGAEDTGSDEFLTSSLLGSLQLAVALLETMVMVGCSDGAVGMWAGFHSVCLLARQEVNKLISHWERFRHD